MLGKREGERHTATHGDGSNDCEKNPSKMGEINYIKLCRARARENEDHREWARLSFFFFSFFFFTTKEIAVSFTFRQSPFASSWPVLLAHIDLYVSHIARTQHKNHLSLLIIFNYNILQLVFSSITYLRMARRTVEPHDFASAFTGIVNAQTKEKTGKHTSFRKRQRVFGRRRLTERINHIHK